MASLLDPPEQKSTMLLLWLAKTCAFDLKYCLYVFFLALHIFQWQRYHDQLYHIAYGLFSLVHLYQKELPNIVQSLITLTHDWDVSTNDQSELLT